MKRRFRARGQELPYGDGGQGCALQLPGERGREGSSAGQVMAPCTCLAPRQSSAAVPMSHWAAGSL